MDLSNIRFIFIVIIICAGIPSIIIPWASISDPVWINATFKEQKCVVTSHKVDLEGECVEDDGDGDNRYFKCVFGYAVFNITPININNFEQKVVESESVDYVYTELSKNYQIKTNMTCFYNEERNLLILHNLPSVEAVLWTLLFPAICGITILVWVIIEISVSIVRCCKSTTKVQKI